MSIKGDVLPGGINQEIQGVTTQTRAHPDDFNPNVLKPLLDNDVTMSKQLETLPSEALTFRPGYQIVESEQDTAFRLGEIKGRTLVNLLGRIGSMESLTGWAGTSATIALDADNKVSGTYGLTVTAVQPPSGLAYARNVGYLKITKNSGYYLGVCMIKNGTGSGGYLRLSDDISYQNTSSLIKETDKFYPVYVVFDSAQMDPKSTGVRVRLTTTGTSGQTAYFDEVRVYGLSDAEYDAIATMTPEQVSEKYPYVDSMTNITNPYAIVTGGNLLPSFYHMGAVNGAIVDIKSNYEIDLTTNSTIQFIGIGNMEARYKTYRIDFHSMGTNVKCYFNEQTAIDLKPIRQHEIDSSGATIEIGDDTKYIGVFFGNMSSTGSFKVKNPMLVPGTEPKPFVPQQRSMLAFETELAAHPADGSNPDTLFMGDDGLPYVLEKWGKVDLDGSHVWKRHSTQNDFKVVSANDCVPNNSSPTDEDDYGRLFVIKYNGSLLTVNDKPVNVENWNFSDITRIFTSNAYISVHNNESGWGGEYNPTQDEIKAYFLGWRMYDSSTLSTPYNRTDGQHKAWAKIYCGVGIDGGIGVKGSETLTLPTVMNDMGYSPYRLQYLKAKPTVEPVRNNELGATLTAGSNMVKVSSGIGIRERFKPFIYNGTAFVGNKAHLDSYLKHPAASIVNIYTEGKVDFNWRFLSAYGWGAAETDANNIDPTAVYHVTYTLLDPTLAAPISGTVAENLRGTVSDLVQDVGDFRRRLSVVENSKADAVEDTGWIPVTPISGWTTFAAIPLRFRIIGNRLLLRGAIQGGSSGNLLQLFALPIKAPGYNSYFGAVTWGGGTVATANCLLSSGAVLLNTGTAGTYISFDGLEWLIDGLEVKKS
ncbi:hypothetical protein NDS46_22540 [Paenibacillus thiaminolyticus]|uniref:hypothetical protein n=1 Tax=Paenibacillus thiaminolyticus TaxID=49283 RepID=UPI00232ED94D|nr:hypothetical protein [Paenibacillus thiaminolyticus]WCF07088.1 hypothetical protein NDS46_22540 [Paenibacillus thiaminolyticus]